MPRHYAATVHHQSSTTRPLISTPRAAAAGAFDRNDLLFMRQEEDKRRFAEIEQEEQERLAVSWRGQCSHATCELLGNGQQAAMHLRLQGLLQAQACGRMREKPSILAAAFL